MKEGRKKVTRRNVIYLKRKSMITLITDRTMYPLGQTLTLISNKYKGHTPEPYANSNLTI